jgi:hypothetical protein
LLAAGVEQRVQYGDFLYVWGKDRVLMTKRMADLIRQYEVRPNLNLPFCGLTILYIKSAIRDGTGVSAFHPFEPSLMEDSLRATETNLGHLIFGDHWHALASSAGIELPKDVGSDALTRYYFKRKLSKFSFTRLY